MSEFEVLMRRGLLPMFAIDDGGGGGAADDDNDDDLTGGGTGDDGGQQDQPLTLTQAELDARIAEAVRVQGQEALERQRQELAARMQQQQPQYQPQPQDPAAVRASRIAAITDELDEGRRTEMLLDLAKDELRQEIQPALAHSAHQGTVTAILSAAADMPDQAKQYVDEVVRTYGIAPDAVDARNPSAQANLALIKNAAIGLAYERKAFDVQPAPPSRVAAPRPAPTGAVASRGNSFVANLTPEQKAILDGEIKMLKGDSGKTDEEILAMFTQRDLAEMFANTNMAGAMR